MEHGGIAQPDVVDLVSREADGSFALVIVLTQPIATREELERLQRKLGAYLVFALEGQMHELYPESRGTRAAIRIDSEAPVSPDLQGLLDRARVVLAEKGLDLVVRATSRKPRRKR